MKKEQWEYIVNNWGTSDPVVMEEINKIKDADAIEAADLTAKLEEREKKILELTQQNVDLNKTNMNLILRLTDPSIPPDDNEGDDEYTAPSITDLDAFVTED